MAISKVKELFYNQFSGKHFIFSNTLNEIYSGFNCLALNINGNYIAPYFNCRFLTINTFANGVYYRNPDKPVSVAFKADL